MVLPIATNIFSFDLCPVNRVSNVYIENEREKSKVCVQVNRTDSHRRTRSVNPLRTIILAV